MSAFKAADLFRKVVSAVKTNPVATVGGAVGADLGYHMLGKPVYQGLKTQAGGRKRESDQIQMEWQELLRQRGRESQVRRLERDMAENAARLAAVNPHLYNTVMAGRRLPKGAVVLGGQPRTDLLEELAMRMASGEYQRTDPLDGLV